jgi:HK97 family phage major capsid protein
MSEAVNEVVKALKDASDAIRSASAQNEERVNTLVEEKVKEIMRNHPGKPLGRQLSFDQSINSTREEILAAIPKEVQVEMDNLYILSSIMKCPANQLKRYAKFKKQFDAVAGELKALDSTTAGGVDEWVPTVMSPQLKDKIRLQLKVAGLFDTLSMPSNPYDVPVQVGDLVSFLQNENTADTGQTLIPVGDTGNVSNKLTFSAKGHMTRVLTSKEATEDSIVPILPWIQRNIVLALAQGREDAIVNGYTGTHIDSDTEAGSAQGRRRLFKGIRGLAIDNSYTTDLSTLSKDNLLTMMGNMGVYGVNPADLAWVTSIAGWIKLMKIDGVDTLDKFGPSAVLLSGQLGSILGIPIIASEYVRTDLNASGVYAAASSKTVIQLVNRRSFLVGERSTISTQLLTELYAASNQNALLATERIDFQPVFPIASNRQTELGINVG